MKPSEPKIIKIALRSARLITTAPRRRSTAARNASGALLRLAAEVDQRGRNVGLVAQVRQAAAVERLRGAVVESLARLAQALPTGSDAQWRVVDHQDRLVHEELPTVARLHELANFWSRAGDEFMRGTR